MAEKGDITSREILQVFLNAPEEEVKLKAQRCTVDRLLEENDENHGNRLELLLDVTACIPKCCSLSFHFI